MGLGSGRRAMKSPPLLIAVLLACVFVLGINYWITSTRCVELQSRVMELEGRIRRAAAERGAVEMKKNEYEDMLTKQKNQIDTIQTLHNSQMQNMQQLCKSEKVNLLSNLSTKESLIQSFQAEIADVQKKLEDYKLEFKELQESQAKKSSYELAQCSNKIAEVNEQCEERIRRLRAKDGNTVNEEYEKDTTTTKLKKPVTSKQEINQKPTDMKEEQKLKVVVSTAASTRKDDVPLPQNNEQTKKLNVAVDEKQSSPSPQESQKQEEEEEKEKEAHNEVNPNLANADEEDDEPKVEDAEDPNKEAENYEVERENLINMDGQSEDEKVTQKVQKDKEKINDYNGDEANEAESETEKQVELGAYDQRPRGVKSGNTVNELAVNHPAEGGDDSRLK
ncbi:Golgi membrane protein 1 isoform X2 [Hyla sarda]|uniref:Golgi membrane protein 1 isoform X2 n=1 Tax=Hyla sarda TaxID=327740 RepID=UPI0024C39F1A|nr:Golgi membrane protein 1 isoform X2 [Hyla sarda]